ncbi:MAG: hypothetical protein ABSF90_02510 [Syntrophobacteraceae bacterium]
MIKAYLVGTDELIARLDAMPGRLEQYLFKEMSGLAIDLATFIRSDYLSGQVVNAPSGIGRRSTQSQGVEQTSDSITATVRTGGPEAPYMKWLNDGVAAYDILPKNKMALAFTWQGREWVLKRVHHPEQKGRHFMENALKAFTPTVKKRLEKAVRDAIKTD